MSNVVILYCGSSFSQGLFDKVLCFGLKPALLPSDTPLETIMALNPLAILITGSPDYVNSHNAPSVDKNIYTCGRPVLGICYGMQLMAKDFGGQVKRMAAPERECVAMKFGEPSKLFHDFADDSAPVWMVHSCKVTEVPANFSVTGSTKVTEAAAMEDEERGLYAVQFHPEHRGKDPSSQAGTSILWNFFNKICGYEVG